MNLCEIVFFFVDKKETNKKISPLEIGSFVKEMKLLSSLRLNYVHVVFIETSVKKRKKRKLLLISFFSNFQLFYFNFKNSIKNLQALMHSEKHFSSRNSLNAY